MATVFRSPVIRGYIACRNEDGNWYLDVTGMWHQEKAKATLMHADFGAAILNGGDLCGPGRIKPFWVDQY